MGARCVSTKPKSASSAALVRFCIRLPALIPHHWGMATAIATRHASKIFFSTAKPASSKKPPVTATDTVETKKPEDTPIQGFEGNNTYDGMTQKDIPRLLQWARSDAGNGNYAKAAQEYRVILQLEPGNPDAREGLRKIQVAQQRSP